MELCISCIYLTYIVWNMCENLHYESVYISKRYTTSKYTVDRQYTERGQLQCQLILVYHIKRNFHKAICLQQVYNDSSGCDVILQYCTAQARGEHMGIVFRAVTPGTYHRKTLNQRDWRSHSCTAYVIVSRKKAKCFPSKIQVYLRHLATTL